MGYSVYLSNEEITTKAGFGRVAHIPCIFDSRPGYDRVASRYLIDRGTGSWHPLKRLGALMALPPSKKSLENYANWLVNFLNWTEARGVSLVTCDYYEQIFKGYQQEMLEGTWSQSGRPLSARTANSRVQQACDYVAWMADRGLRPAFDVPYQMVRVKMRRATSTVGHRGAEVRVRQGKARQSKRRLRMPTDAQLYPWLQRIETKYGHTKSLMCETVLLTAMRREEVSAFRVDTLPENPSDWHINNILAPESEQSVLVTIKFGAKGKEYGFDAGDKIGPQRDIWIPLELAKRIHLYRNQVRPVSLKKYIKSSSTLSEQMARIKCSVHLFLDEKTGCKITGKQLYNIWTGVELPFKGWTPHLGRDWWACSVLWKEISRNRHLLQLGIEAASPALEMSARDVIRLIIQPQLGHTSEETTMIYLQWIADMMNFNLTIRYVAELSEEITGEAR